MASHGHLGEFDAIKDDWTSYIERAQQYFAANDIDSPAKMHAVLISACGPATYRIIKDVLTPIPNQIAQRCKFFSHTRCPHELFPRELFAE